MCATLDTVDVGSGPFSLGNGSISSLDRSRHSKTVDTCRDCAVELGPSFLPALLGIQIEGMTGALGSSSRNWAMESD